MQPQSASQPTFNLSLPDKNDRRRSLSLIISSTIVPPAVKSGWDRQ
jgi:hypothetical protein